MLPFYKDFLDRMGDLHREIAHALDGLPAAALDWSPGPEMNSIGVLVVHLTGAERYWIGDVALQAPSGRDRDAEFRVRELDAAALEQRLADSLAYAARALDQLTLADLEATRPSPRDGRQFTVAWALLHALEHTAIHLGHIQIMRQMWEARVEGSMIH
jgi:uncharacterized damage-inducible protein DinB